MTDRATDRVTDGRIRSRASKFRSALAALACAAILALTPGARADDKVTLKDGRVLEGVITREEQGHVWIKVKYGGLDRELYFGPGEVSKVERDAPAGDPAKAAPGAKPADGTQARQAGVPRVAIVTLGDRSTGKDMVGLYMVADVLRDGIPLLEQEGVTDVVLLFNSGGGSVELLKISDLIENEYKPRFRVVAWIDMAISAAAMSAHCIEEIYFQPTGKYGACTGFYGASLVAIKDRPLEEMLFEMEQISARGKYDINIMRSMQIMEPLSFSRNEYGEVVWFPDLSGKQVVNPEGRILTFNSQQALECGFSRGTARTYDELAALMGYQEVEWVGEKVTGVPYPVCKAEKLQRSFRDRTYNDAQSTNQYFTSYQMAVGAAQGAGDPKDRAKAVGIARQWLDKIEAMVRKNKHIATMVIGSDIDRFKEWIEEQRELLRELLR